MDVTTLKIDVDTTSAESSMNDVHSKILRIDKLLHDNTLDIKTLKARKEIKTVQKDIKKTATVNKKATKEMGSGWSILGKSTKNFGFELYKINGLIAGIGAIAATGMAAFSFTKKTREIEDFSKRLRITTDEMQIFRAVVRGLALDDSDFVGFVQGVNAAVAEAGKGTGDAADAFWKLGINIESFSKMRAPERLIKLSEVIKEARDESGKFSSEFEGLLIKVFGEDDAAKVVPFLDNINVGMDELMTKHADELIDSATIIDANESMIELETQWDTLVNKFAKPLTVVIKVVSGIAGAVGDQIDRDVANAKSVIQSLQSLEAGNPYEYKGRDSRKSNKVREEHAERRFAVRREDFSIGHGGNTESIAKARAEEMKYVLENYQSQITKLNGAFISLDIEQRIKEVDKKGMRNMPELNSQIANKGDVDMAALTGQMTNMFGMDVMTEWWKTADLTNIGPELEKHFNNIFGVIEEKIKADAKAANKGDGKPPAPPTTFDVGGRTLNLDGMTPTQATKARADILKGEKAIFDVTSKNALARAEGQEKLNKLNAKYLAIKLKQGILDQNSGKELIAYNALELERIAMSETILDEKKSIAKLATETAKEAADALKEEKAEWAEIAALRAEMVKDHGYADLNNEVLEITARIKDTKAEILGLDQTSKEGAIEAIRLEKELHGLIASRPKAVKDEEDDAQAELDKINAKIAAYDKEAAAINKLESDLEGLKAIEASGMNVGDAITNLEYEIDMQTKPMFAMLEDFRESARENISEGFTSDLMEAVKGTQTLADAFTNMTNSIVEDLMQIGIKKMITDPLADALFAKGEDGKQAGIMSGLIGKMFGGGGTSAPKAEGSSGGGFMSAIGTFLGGMFGGGGAAHFGRLMHMGGPSDNQSVVVRRGESISPPAHQGALSGQNQMKEPETNFYVIDDPQRFEREIAKKPGVLLGTIASHRKQANAALGKQ